MLLAIRGNVQMTTDNAQQQDPKMTDLIAVQTIAGWEKLKTLVLDSVSSPITKRVYNMALDEFMGWFQQAPRSGFTKATVSAWRVSFPSASVSEGSSKVMSRYWPALNVQFDGFSKRNVVVRSATSCLLTSLDRVTGEAVVVVMSFPSRGLR
jgi:hypothetical protein